jgi:hypothetical protein
MYTNIIFVYQSFYLTHGSYYTFREEKFHPENFLNNLYVEKNGK